MRIKTETSVGLFILVAVGIFLYMSFQIGVIRFDTARYSRYTVYFHDVSGLSKKADVQMAGVKVGWVEEVGLVNNGQQVRAEIMVLGSYPIYSDAYGLVRQDGLLGTKYVEIIPGDPHMPRIKPGGILMRPSKEPVAVDAMLGELRDIARNIQEVSASLKTVFAGDAGVQRLERVIDNFGMAAERASEVVSSIGGVVNRNEQSFDEVMRDLRSIATDLKREIPSLSSSVRDGITQAAEALDRDLGRVAQQFEETAHPITQAARKITDGEGVIGKLVTDEDLSQNLTMAIDGVKKYFSQIDKLSVIFDVHGESMYGLGNEIGVEDGKGYLDVRVHPTEDYFYLGGLVGCYSGTIARYHKYREWYNEHGCPLNPDDMELTDYGRLKYAHKKDVQVRQLDSSLYDLQFGKVYGPFAFRGGLFESTFGVGIDFDIPFNWDNVRWVTSFEAFDLRGRNRLGDDRPHLKWLNKIFFADTLYMVFGADDFVSKTNKNAFAGVGIRFADDDIKYLISKVSVGS